MKYVHGSIDPRAHKGQLIWKSAQTAKQPGRTLMMLSLLLIFVAIGRFYSLIRQIEYSGCGVVSYSQIWREGVARLCDREGRRQFLKACTAISKLLLKRKLAAVFQA